MEKGEARLLYTPRVLTKSGQEARVKGVTEYIYPSDFEVATPISTDAPRSTVVSQVVHPPEFETREVGVILNVLPEVTPYGNMINLTLSPETVYSPTWKNYGSRQQTEGRTNSPWRYHSFIRTHCRLLSWSQMALIAGGMNNQAGDKTVFAFITARLMDIDGKPIARNDESGEAEN